ALRRAPRSTLVPYTTLFRSYRDGAEPGATITFDRVLLANGGGASQIGSPLLDGASVTAEVIRPELKGDKLEIGKFKRRKNSRRQDRKSTRLNSSHVKISYAV